MYLSLKFCTLLFLPFSFSLSGRVFGPGLVFCDAGKSIKPRTVSLICFVKIHPCPFAFHLYFKSLLLFRLPTFFFFWGKVKFIVYFYIIFKLSEQILLRKKVSCIVKTKWCHRLWQILVDSVHVEQPRRGDTVWGCVLTLFYFIFL